MRYTKRQDSVKLQVSIPDIANSIIKRITKNVGLTEGREMNQLSLPNDMLDVNSSMVQ